MGGTKLNPVAVPCSFEIGAQNDGGGGYKQWGAKLWGVHKKVGGKTMGVRHSNRGHQIGAKNMGV